MPSLSDFFAEYGELLLQGTGETLVMLFVPTLISYVLGIALGVVLYLTAPGSLRPVPALNAVLGWVVNICRSFPFIVLMVSIIPLTRLIMGTGSGILGTIPPLVLSATPFIEMVCPEPSFGWITKSVFNELLIQSKRRYSVSPCTSTMVFGRLMRDPPLCRGPRLSLSNPGL